jgi:hypothetical protein
MEKACSQQLLLQDGPVRLTCKAVVRRTGPSPLIWSLAAAFALVLLAVPILMFNSRHSGDGLKIRRELRKF